MAGNTGPKTALAAFSSPLSLQIFPLIPIDSEHHNTIAQMTAQMKESHMRALTYLAQGHVPHLSIIVLPTAQLLSVGTDATNYDSQQTLLLMDQIQQSDHLPSSSAQAQHCASPSLASGSSRPTVTADIETFDTEHNAWDPAEKPKPPYKEGCTFTAFRHKPPGPFGLEYDTGPLPSDKKWKRMSQRDYCLSQQPLAGRTDLTSCRSMTITSIIRTGEHQGAQIAVINNDMVAKIYYPPYYPPEDIHATKNDVIADADGDYSREAAAFAQIQLSSEAKAVTPSFHGTWTTTIATHVERSRDNALDSSRPVRFILMERCQGICLEDITAWELREEVRSMILKKTIIAETLLYDAGIHHRDLCPRNVMVEGLEYKESQVEVGDIDLRIKLIDFNIANVTTHPTYCGWNKPREPEYPLKLPSPITRYFGLMAEFSTRGWCVDGQNLEAANWLWEHFRDDDRYIPVSWDPNDPWEWPVRIELSENLCGRDSTKDKGPKEGCRAQQSSSLRGSESSEDRDEGDNNHSKTDSDVQNQT
ncbi:hypothetical protein DE146DRAFT_732620 [Phaeosphaeria sp. MPI-PUGE-AT-0046c]|nr:hypothetical protein DE146DRAFT_732620 [Phaeosphaeria sp. MPI-PUGE-AT-0046c]